MNPDTNPDRTISGSFPTTHWSLVVKAGSPASPQAKAALEELCSAYWYPIYAFVRRKGNDPDRALDLTQESSTTRSAPCSTPSARSQEIGERFSSEMRTWNWTGTSRPLTALRGRAAATAFV